MGHSLPAKRQLSPHNHREIKYGAYEQYTHIVTPSPNLDAKGVLCIQSIVGALLFYRRAVNNKLLVALNIIGLQ